MHQRTIIYNKYLKDLRNKENIHYFSFFNTIIAKIDKNRNVTVAEDWSYSKTTRKHLYIWLRDIARMTYIVSEDDFIKAVKRKEIKIVETLKY